MWRPLDDNVRESIKKNVTDHLQFGALHRYNVGMIQRVLLASEEPTGPVANGAAWQKVPIHRIGDPVPAGGREAMAHGSYHPAPRRLRDYSRR
jgi:hypothetical protein